MITLQERLKQDRTLLLDGAMGTELERRGVAMHGQAWSALAMLSAPDLVREVHRDYVAAGAEIHIANTFATARHVLEQAGHGGDVARFNRQAVALCREAIETADDGRRHWIAGSMSSFSEPADRSKLPRGKALEAIFEEQAGLLAEAGVDLLALEMLADIEVSQALVAAAGATGLPLMIGFTCIWSDDRSAVRTRAEEMRLGGSSAIEQVLPEVFAAIPDGVLAVPAVMHCDLDVTTAALAAFAEHWSGPLAAYPNSGSFVPPNWQFEAVCAPEVFAAAAGQWASDQVRIVGGCCGIGPDHIRAAARVLT